MRNMHKHLASKTPVMKSHFLKRTGKGRGMNMLVGEPLRVKRTFGSAY